MEEAFLGMDLGTTFLKTTALNESGERILEMRSNAPDVLSPRPGWTEVNPFEYYFKFRRFIRKAMRTLGARRINLGLSSMAPVMIPVDETCYPIYNGILYNDTRSAEEIREIERDYGEIILNENGNAVNAQQWLPKLLWLKRYLPEVYNRTWKFLELPTFILCKLSGEVVSNVTFVQEEGFLNYKTGRLSEKIIDELKVDAEKLPEFTGVADQVVEFSMDGVSFRATTGTVDFIGSSVSLGLLEEGKLAFMLGSTGVPSYSTSSPRPDRRLYLDVGPYQGLYYVNGATSAAGIFLDYIMEIVGMKNKYRRLERMLEEKRINVEGTVALPYILGERTPIFDPYAKGVIFGITNRTGKAEILQAAIDAIAFSMRHHYDIMLELGYRPTRVLLSGSLSNLRAMAVAVANSLGREIIKVKGESESVGDAIIALVASGRLSWRDALKLAEEKILVGEVVKPSPAQWIEKNYRIYLQLYLRLKDLFQE